MRNFREVSSGQDLEIPAEWYNEVTRGLNNGKPTKQGGRNTGVLPIAETIAQIGNPLPGDNVYRGKFLASAVTVINTAEALDPDDFFDPAKTYADCIVIDWSNPDGTGHVLTSGKTLPAIFNGFGKIDGGPLLPIFHVGAGATLPIPQYQYMVFQAVTQNQMGADWLHAHDLV